MEVRIVKDLEVVKEANEAKEVKENARAAQWREGWGEWPSWWLNIKHHITT